MYLRDVVQKLNAEVLTPGPDMEAIVEYAFTSDLMSDVLTQDYHRTILITGLANNQSIRTAEVSDIGFLIIGRNKEISPEMISLASEAGIVLIRSTYSLFRISGILFKEGLKPVF